MSDINIAVTVEPALDITLNAEPVYDITMRLESVQGVGVQGLVINDAGHLLVTLSNGTVLDAGAVGVDVTAETARAEAAEAALAAAISGGGSYLFTQAAPVAVWAVNHGLDRPCPEVNIVVDGAKVSADVQYVDSNNLLIIFTVAVAGSAQIN